MKDRTSKASPPRGKQRGTPPTPAPTKVGTWVFTRKPETAMTREVKGLHGAASKEGTTSKDAVDTGIERGRARLSLGAHQTHRQSPPAACRPSSPKPHSQVCNVDRRRQPPPTGPTKPGRHLTSSWLPHSRPQVRRRRAAILHSRHCEPLAGRLYCSGQIRPPTQPTLPPRRPPSPCSTHPDPSTSAQIRRTGLHVEQHHEASMEADAQITTTAAPPCPPRAASQPPPRPRPGAHLPGRHPGRRPASPLDPGARAPDPPPRSPTPATAARTEHAGTTASWGRCPSLPSSAP